MELNKERKKRNSVMEKINLCHISAKTIARQEMLPQNFTKIFVGRI
jgi:hypothetical protein